ncbi:MAG: stress response translation initiation inhibitor YciH, partial [Caldimonas sp.]
MNKPARGGLVYSTEAGRMCPGCRRPVAACVCAAASHGVRAPAGGVRVSRESKGRGGKVVTLIRG